MAHAVKSSMLDSDNQSAPLDVEVWFDIVCPFCYIGKRRLEGAMRQYGGLVRVSYRSYQLSPEAPRQTDDDLNTLLQRRYGMSRAQALEANSNAGELAASFGLHFDFAAARWANTFDAHRLIKLASKHGLQDAAVESISKAFFSDGRRIGEPATLRALTIDIGVPAEEVDQVLDSERFADEIARDRSEAARIGLRGVPLYRIGGESMGSESINASTLARFAVGT
jgi:predicted DsbA family dithiol-disulfide isomerase